MVLVSLSPIRRPQTSMEYGVWENDSKKYREPFCSVTWSILEISLSAGLWMFWAKPSRSGDRARHKKFRQSRGDVILVSIGFVVCPFLYFEISSGDIVRFLSDTEERAREQLSECEGGSGIDYGSY